jgi:arylsulfatase A-like enzyme
MNYLRSNFRDLAGLVFACAALGAPGLPAATTSPTAVRAARPPNILFILADDLGYGDVSCYGRPDFRTPAIDQIAARGMRFTQAYANAPVCTLTRVALMTGRYQHRLRVGLEEPLTARNPEIGLPAEHPTLPSLLKRAGYRTMLIGKWHLGFLPKFGPLQSGYDRFYGFRAGGTDYFRAGREARADFWDGDTLIQPEGYLTDLLGERTVQAIEEFANGDAPFLISLHFNAPHWPWEGPGDEAESKRLQESGGRIFHADGGSQKTYREMIEAMDRQIGRVLAALDARGLTENTIVIFTSDNGGERFSYTWPFTGRKSELLEGGLRVPAIVSWPAKIPPGRVSEQVMITMDWLPTLLAAAGAAPDAQHPCDGVSLLPQLTAEAAPVARRLFWRYKANAQQAVRDGDLKYLKINENTFLFDLAADPMERANLKDRQADHYRRLRRDWFHWHETMLPLIEESFTGGFTAKDLADHIGAKSFGAKPEHPQRPED